LPTNNAGHEPDKHPAVIAPIIAIRRAHMKKAPSHVRHRRLSFTC